MDGAAVTRTTLAIDPGLSLTGGTGYALFAGGALPVLTACGLVVPKAKRIEDRVEEIGIELARRIGTVAADEVVIEKMKVYGLAKQKGDQGDLIDLAHLGGALLCFGTRATLVEPSTWKGQVPKDVSERLVNDNLTMNERALLKRCGVPKSKRHNVYDAVGIGLWKLRRWPR
jgi:hypothetical protein